jgi:MHS family proline/betaine transporter-like MFS transporter
MPLHTWKQRTFLAFGSALEYYNIAVYVALQRYIVTHFFPQDALEQNTLMLSWLPFVFRELIGPIGSIYLGFLAEKKGRKYTLILSSWMTGCATLLIACLPTYDAIGYWATILLFLMLSLQSFSYSGEQPTVLVYLLEHANANEKSRVSALTVVFNILSVSLAYAVVELLSTLLTEVQMQEYGWRIPFFIGAVNLYIGYAFKKKIQEQFRTQKIVSIKADVVTSLQLMLKFAPNTVLFFTNTMAISTLIKKVPETSLCSSWLPTLLTLISCLACWGAGVWLDRQKNPHQVLQTTYLLMIFFAVPVYALQELNTWPTLVISHAIILVAMGVSMAGAIPEMYDGIKSPHKVIALSLGMTFGVILFGAPSPMLAEILSKQGQAYIGLLASLGGLLFFLAMGLEKFTLKQRTTGTTAVS